LVHPVLPDEIILLFNVIWIVVRDLSIIKNVAEVEPATADEIGDYDCYDNEPNDFINVQHLILEHDSFIATASVDESKKNFLKFVDINQFNHSR
jgi:hypothetical protein